MQHNHTNTGPTLVSEPEVVCFGVLSYLQLLLADEAPLVNGGTPISRKFDSFGDDAAIVAAALRRLGVRSRLLPSSLGDDDYGRKVAGMLPGLGGVAEAAIDPKVDTVFEVSIADPAGNRTYFYQRTPDAVATLDRADLGPLETARWLYVDWYDGDHILRPMLAAAELGVPVLVNIESNYRDRGLLNRLVPYASMFQVSADVPGADEDMEQVARTLLDAGLPAVAVTGGSRGCILADKDQLVRVEAPTVPVVDANGAGSFFSAGLIYGHLQGWPLEQCARFATAQASLKCGYVGYNGAPVDEVELVADSLRVQST